VGAALPILGLCPIRSCPLGLGRCYRQLIGLQPAVARPDKPVAPLAAANADTPWRRYAPVAVRSPTSIAGIARGPSSTGGRCARGPAHARAFSLVKPQPRRPAGKADAGHRVLAPA